MLSDDFYEDGDWDSGDPSLNLSSTSSSSLSSASSSLPHRDSEDSVDAFVINITILCTSLAFILYSLIQIIRIHHLAAKINKQQQDRARVTAAAGMNYYAVAPVRFVGKTLFHVCVILSMLFKACATSLEVFGPCDDKSTWPYYGKYCWPMLEGMFRIENILLFLAYFDTFICWTDYLDSATSLLYGASWGHVQSSTGVIIRNKVFIGVGVFFLGVATAVYVLFLFILHDEDSSEYGEAAVFDLAGVTVVGVLYLVTAVGISIQCARFILLTKRVAKSDRSSKSRRRNDSLNDVNGISSSQGSGSLSGNSSGSLGDVQSGLDDRDGSRRSDKLQLGAMFALIISCSLLLLVRAVWPVIAWLMLTKRIESSDWYGFGEHILCEVVPLLCMCALVSPLPNENDVVGSSNGGSRIIVGTSVPQSAGAAEASVGHNSSYSVLSDDDEENREGSVNTMFHSVQDLGSEEDNDDDDDDYGGEGSIRRSLLPQVAAM